MSSTEYGINFHFGKHTIKVPSTFRKTPNSAIKTDLYRALIELNSYYIKKYGTGLDTYSSPSRAIFNTLEESFTTESKKEKTKKIEGFIITHLRWIAQAMEKAIERNFNSVYQTHKQYWELPPEDLLNEIEALQKPFTPLQDELREWAQIKFFAIQCIFSKNSHPQHGLDKDNIRKIFPFSPKTDEELCLFLCQALNSHCCLNLSAKILENLQKESRKEFLRAIEMCQMIFLSREQPLPIDTIAENTLYFKVNTNELAIYSAGVLQGSIPEKKLHRMIIDKDGTKKKELINLDNLSQKFIEEMKFSLIKKAKINFHTHRRKIIENTLSIIQRYVMTNLDQFSLNVPEPTPPIQEKFALVLRESTEQCYKTLKDKLIELGNRLEPSPMTQSSPLFFKVPLGINSKIRELKNANPNDSISIIIEIYNMANKTNSQENPHAKRGNKSTKDKNESTKIISGILKTITHSVVWRSTIASMTNHLDELQDLSTRLCQDISHAQSTDNMAPQKMILNVLKRHCRGIEQDANPIIALNTLYESLKTVHAFTSASPEPALAQLSTIIEEHPSYQFAKKRAQDLEERQSILSPRLKLLFSPRNGPSSPRIFSPRSLLSPRILEESVSSLRQSKSSPR